MTMLMTNQTTDYDGSSSPETAGNGPVIVTFSGTKGKQSPVITMYSRSDTAAFAPMFTVNRFGRFKINLAVGDNYYFTVTVPNGATVDLSVVDAQ